MRLLFILSGVLILLFVLVPKDMSLEWGYSAQEDAMREVKTNTIYQMDVAWRSQDSIGDELEREHVSQFDHPVIAALWDSLGVRPQRAGDRQDPTHSHERQVLSKRFPQLSRIL